MKSKQTSARRILAVEPPTSRLSEARSFVYVLPCLIEDWLKLGFSRDPLQRLRALHPRWFEFFDLDRGLLIETETVRDARRMERELSAGIAEHSAPAPLTIREAAGGGTEWYRGASEMLLAAALDLENDGFTLRRPIARWLRAQLQAQRDGLYSQTQAWSDQREMAIGAHESIDRMDQALRNRLDEYRHLGIDLDPALPEQVLRWYLDHAL